MAAPHTDDGQAIVPTSWREKILKRDFEIVLGKMLQPEQRRPDETEEPYLRSANVQWTGVTIDDIKTMWFSPEEKQSLQLRGGDLVVNEGGDVGRCAIWNGEITECYFQNAINRVRPKKKASARFLFYWLNYLKLSGFIDAIVSRTTIAHLTAEKLEAIPWPDVPPIEQKAIAAYLDASCSANDSAIEAKRRQIEMLDELHRAVVLDAVTLGIDSEASFQPSGIDWAPKVPSHWRIRQIKRMCSLVRGQFTHRPRNDPALYDGDYPFVQTGDITAARKYIRTYSQTLNEQGLAVSRMFPKGTLVMSIAANIGDVAVLDFEACFPDSMVGMIPYHETDVIFLYYLMRAMKPIMLRSAVLSTQLNLNYVRIGTNFAAFPPLGEQRKIVSHLEKKEREIADIKAVLERQIDTLLAYRKSLIHECVTGQRRVASADFSRDGAHA